MQLQDDPTKIRRLTERWRRDSHISTHKALLPHQEIRQDTMSCVTQILAAARRPLPWLHAQTYLRLAHWLCRFLVL